MGKFLLSVLPGPIVAWANAWFSIFSDTILVHQHWQRSADNTAVAITAILAIVLHFTMASTQKTRLNKFAFLSIGVAGVLVFVCFAFYFSLTFGWRSSIVETLKTLWLFSYVVMLVSAMMAITFAAMAKFKK